MGKKILTVMLLTVITVTMLAGCGSSVATNGTMETVSTAKTTENVANKDIEVEESVSNLKTEEDGVTVAEIGGQDIENQDNMSNDSQDTETEDGTVEIEERRWMIISIESEHSNSSQNNEAYVEYDESGRISKTNVNFFTFTSGASEYEYEYIKNGEIKIGDRWYTFDEQGRVAIIKKGTVSWSYTYLDKPQELYSIAGNDKTLTKTYNCIEQEQVSGGLTRYLTQDYSKYRIEQFAIPLHHSDYEYDITVDEYGNPIKIQRNYTTTKGENRYEITYFTYVYCTLNEYFAAKESGDFGGLQMSSYKGR